MNRRHAGQLTLPTLPSLPRPLQFDEVRHLPYIAHDRLGQFSVFGLVRPRKRLSDVRPGQHGLRSIPLCFVTRLRLSVRLAEPPFLFGPHLPKRWVAALLATRRLRCGLGLHAPSAQLVRERLTPSMQVALTWVQPLALL